MGGCVFQLQNREPDLEGGRAERWDTFPDSVIAGDGGCVCVAGPDMGSARRPVPALPEV